MEIEITQDEPMNDTQVQEQEQVEITEEPTKEEDVDLSRTKHDDNHKNKKPAHKRIGELTYKFHEEERQKDAALEKIEKLESMMSSYIQTQTQVANDARIKDLNSDLSKAWEDNDQGKALEIIEQLRSIPTQEQQVQSEPVVQQAQQSSPTVDQLGFIARNSTWWDQDIAMTNTAKYYDQQMLNDPYWQGQTEASRLAEVESLIKRDFPHKFSGQTPQSAIGSPSGQAPPKKTYKISQARIERQKMLNPKGTRGKSDKEVGQMLYNLDKERGVV